MISKAEYNWSEVVRNMFWMRAVWKRMTRILSREGEETRASGFFFIAVAQAVLIVGSETWVITPRMGRALEVFQDEVEKRLTGRLLRRKPDEKWTYTS